MHILFLTDNFPPEVNALASRTYEHILSWGKEGTKITIITCFPNFPLGKVYDGYKNSLYKKELATYGKEDLFDQKLAKGFIEIWGMPYRKK